MTNDSHITVIGGTGKVGRRVAARLRERGHEVRAASRAGTTRFDWTDPDTWARALDGTAAVYITPYDAGDAEMFRAFTETAVASGARRLVLLSARQWRDLGVEPALVREEIVRDSGTAWTVLRPVWFAQNFGEEPFLADGVAAGEVVHGVGEGRHAFVDAEDIADVATAALVEDGHDGQVYELSGPRALSLEEAVAQIGAATGREVRAVAVSSEEYRRFLERYLPAEVAAELVQLFDFIRSGADARLSDGVQRALGREPRAFAEYAKTAAASGVWDR
ncbi:NAD(P)H-binding protein [Thermobifida halotolerans]|uniref:NAD(P)H-binding protein n=1 Tax=Thermobifida halotolerans TaxID=483545 RepID=A0A399G335_9ACTN|nr:NAD(P)H-binding protein [Thermobifida halotolerans]UOE19986.1 NAD(P)H-binding protein [Thermobifida halotolerans]